MIGQTPARRACPAVPPSPGQQRRAFWLTRAGGTDFWRKGVVRHTFPSPGGDHRQDQKTPRLAPLRRDSYVLSPARRL